MKKTSEKEEETKWRYIHLICEASDHYGDPYLTGLMDRYNSPNTIQITAKQAKSYYLQYVLKEGAING